MIAVALCSTGTSLAQTEEVENPEEIGVYVEDGMHGSPVEGIPVSIWSDGERKWLGRTDDRGLAGTDLPAGTYEIRVGMRVTIFTLVIRRETVVLEDDPVYVGVRISNLFSIPVRYVSLLIDVVVVILLVTLGMAALPRLVGGSERAPRKEMARAGRATPR